MNSLLTEIKHKSLVEQIVDELEKRILSGALKPGQRLIETTLSESFNVSRASVREALRILESRGFVHSVPRKGVSVSRLSAQEARDIFEIRSSLESLALALAIRRQSPELMVKLRRIYGEMVAAAHEGNVDRYRIADIKFHETIYYACGNDMLAKLVDGFNKQTMRYREEYFNTPSRLVRSVEIHGTILSFFENNEPEKAEKYRKRSMMKNLEILVSNIKERETELNGDAS